jgi:hypothetical protein
MNRTMYQRIVGNDAKEGTFYVLIEGKQFNTTRVREPLPKNSYTFMGSCYLCKTPNHSKKYCPLRFCKKCCKFGHSFAVCPDNEKRESYDTCWRSSGSTSSTSTTRYRSER